MAYEAKDYSALLGSKHFDEGLLSTHFKLYQGYVANTNTLIEKVRGEVDAQAKVELQRRMGWEFNGMRLHELYFDQLALESTALGDGDLKSKIEAQFGSLEAWKEDFMRVATSRGIGWTVLFYDEVADKLYNVWIEEHDGGLLATGKILLIMDVFEHAFIKQFGTDRIAYSNAFFDSLNWDVVASRL